MLFEFCVNNFELQLNGNVLTLALWYKTVNVSLINMVSPQVFKRSKFTKHSLEKKHHQQLFSKRESAMRTITKMIVQTTLDLVY